MGIFQCGHFSLWAIFCVGIFRVGNNHITNLYSEAYKNVYKMIKIVLTLSVTQVQCERTFNILKYIKNHLRNRLTDDHVDALHIMNGNKDLLLSIENEAIIKEICNGSSEFTKNLLI